MAPRARPSSAPSGHFPGKVRTFKGQRQDRDDSSGPSRSPRRVLTHLEWKDLIEAIVRDKPYNEVPRGVEASLVTSMGRMAAHTGQEITYDQMLNCPHEMAPGVADFTHRRPGPGDAGRRRQISRANAWDQPRAGIRNDRLGGSINRTVFCESMIAQVTGNEPVVNSGGQATGANRQRIGCLPNGIVYKWSGRELNPRPLHCESA